MAISAVITADIVNSTLLSAGAEKRLRDKLINILKPYKYEFYRGDSFQVLVKDPAQALTMVLQIRAEARKEAFMHDVRASIGIGEVNPYLKKLSTATDEAFIISGRSFDQLAKSDDRLTMQCAHPTVNSALKVIAYFVDYLFRNLTTKQAEVLFVLLDEKTQQEAARKLRKSASTINQHAQAGGWHEMMKLIEEYQSLVSTLQHGNTMAD